MSTTVHEGLNCGGIASVIGGCGGTVPCFLLQPEDNIPLPCMFERGCMGRLLLGFWCR
jgi:hypothetical protein